MTNNVNANWVVNGSKITKSLGAFLSKANFCSLGRLSNRNSGEESTTLSRSHFGTFKSLVCSSALAGMTLAMFAVSAPNDAYAQQTQVAAAQPAAQQKAKMTREDIGPWRLECFEPMVNGVKCQLTQETAMRATGQTVMALAFASGQESGPIAMQLVSPLNVDLVRGATITIGATRKTLNFNRCDARGCFVEQSLEANLFDMLSLAGDKQASVTVHRYNGKPFAVPISLKQFRDAIDVMNARNQNAALQ